LRGAWRRGNPVVVIVGKYSYDFFINHWIATPSLAMTNGISPRLYQLLMLSVNRPKLFDQKIKTI